MQHSSSEKALLAYRSHWHTAPVMSYVLMRNEIGWEGSLSSSSSPSSSSSASWRWERNRISGILKFWNKSLSHSDCEDKLRTFFYSFTAFPWTLLFVSYFFGRSFIVRVGPTTRFSFGRPKRSWMSRQKAQMMTRRADIVIGRLTSYSVNKNILNQSVPHIFLFINCLTPAEVKFDFLNRKPEVNMPYWPEPDYRKQDFFGFCNPE